MIDKKMTNKTCPQCLKTFTTEIPYKQVYCTHECQIKFNANKIRRNIIHQKTCLKCLRSFKTKYTHRKRCIQCSPKTKNILQKAYIDQFIKKYCEIGDYYIDGDFFYKILNVFRKKHNIIFDINNHMLGRTILYGYLKFKYNINRANRAHGKNTRKVLKGIKFNKKGVKKFGIQNIANLQPKMKINSHKDACIETSCYVGQDELLRLYNNLDKETKFKINIEEAKDVYKEIEIRMFKLNIYRKKIVKIVLTFYLSSSLTQEEICNISSLKISSVTLRTLKNLINIEKSKLKYVLLQKITKYTKITKEEIENITLKILEEEKIKSKISKKEKINPKILEEEKKKLKIKKKQEITKTIIHDLKIRNEILNFKIRNGEL